MKISEEKKNKEHTSCVKNYHNIFQAVQRKSIPGLRLGGSRCTERAAAISGSTSAHWDSSWSHKSNRKEARQEGRIKIKIVDTT